MVRGHVVMDAAAAAVMLHGAGTEALRRGTNLRGSFDDVAGHTHDVMALEVAV